MASIIKIKRSGTAGAPSSLKLGEQAYSFLSGTQSNGGDRLYIGTGGVDGSGNANNIDVVGGKYFTDLLDHVTGTLTASSAILVDANKKIDNLIIDNIDINGNTISTTNANGALVLSPNGTATVTVPAGYESRSGYGDTSLATKKYVDDQQADVSFTFRGDAGNDTLDLADSDFFILGGTGLSTAVTGGAGQNSTVTINLDNTGVTAATYGSATAIPIIAVNAQGQITTASTANISTTLDVAGDTGTHSLSLLDSAITIAGGTGLASVVADETVTLNISNTGVSAGSYGSATAVATFTVNAQGQLTAAGTANIATTLNLTADDAGSQAIDLLTETLDIEGGEGIDTTASTANKIIISGEDATTTNKGIASFASAQFDVSSGAVSIKDATTTVKGIASFNTDMFTVSSGAVSAKDVTFTSQSGSSGRTLGETLTINGATAGATGGTLIATSISSDVLTITPRLATTAVTGVASFSSADFAVSGAGAVTVKAGGITNTQLAGSIANAKLSNSTVSFDADNSSAIDIALGGTLDIEGTSAQGISTATSSGKVTITAANASTTAKGVASFSSNDFAVSSGAVTIKAAGVSATQLEGTLDLSGKSVTLANGEISNAELANSSLTINGTTIALGASGSIDTDAISEGSNNLYYTDARATAAARAAVSVTDAGGDGSLAYNSSTGVLTYTGPSAAEVRAHFAAGTGLTYTQGTGTFALEQSLSPTDSVTFAGLKISNNIVVDGNLLVRGTQTNLETRQLSVDDPLIMLGDSANVVSDVLDIGFYGRYSEDGGTTKRKTGLFRDATDDTYYLFHDLIDSNLDSSAVTSNVINRGAASFALADLKAGMITANLTGNVTGTVSSLANHDTDDLSEGSTNLYYTNGRVDTRVTAFLAGGTGITLSAGGGQLTINGDNAAADGSTKGVATFTASQFNASSGVISAEDITFTANSGTAPQTLGEAISILGDGTVLTTTASGGNTITITAANAVANGSTKGVATFNATHFSDNGSGVISLDPFQVTGDDGTGRNILPGDTFSVLGTSSQGITTASAAGQVTISANNATLTTKGVASFGANADSAGDTAAIKQFAVSSGAVSISVIDGGTY